MQKLKTSDNPASSTAKPVATCTPIKFRTLCSKSESLAFVAGPPPVRKVELCMRAAFFLMLFLKSLHTLNHAKNKGFTQHELHNPQPSKFID